MGCPQVIPHGQRIRAQPSRIRRLVSQSERSSYYDRFRGRLMFPIRNRNGRSLGLAQEHSPRRAEVSKFTPELLFDKSSTLYGLDLAKDSIRSQNLAVIVEGYMDVIGAHQAGFTNVVASLNGAHRKAARAAQAHDEALRFGT